jgi:murein DD-endopeptidase MepM/ murein hydrolase activator NlpD
MRLARVAILSRSSALLRAALASPAWVASVWGREYRDARIIIEQGGELRYLSVSGRWQRLCARGGLLLAGALMVAVLVLSAAALALHRVRASEAFQHQEIYRALSASFQGLGKGEGGDITVDEMMAMAQNIRKRDLEVRGIVASISSQLSSENMAFKSLLEGSGLTEKAIKIIQDGGGVGGFGAREVLDSVAKDVGELVGPDFLAEVADNRLLLDTLGALPSELPLSTYRVSSPFGVRKHPLLRKPILHQGVDLVPQESDEVVTVGAGRIIFARPFGSYGKTVIVRHERGIESLYAHLDKILVVEGQQVENSTLLGMVGNTGASTGKHLHFEITVGGIPVDPLKVIRTSQYVQQAKN